MSEPSAATQNALQTNARSKAGSWSAPGRVNLLGEHTDYTGGFVLPMAINFATTATITPADDDQYHFDSASFPERRTQSRDDRSPKQGGWADYPTGVLRQMQALGLDIAPFILHIDGNVPLGAGLSSSASIEVATAVALLGFSGHKLPLEEIAVLCRRAENQYVGAPSGIMDQFVSTAAKAGHALLLNTRTLAYEHLPIATGTLATTRVVVTNSMVKHSIASGEYSVRYRQVMDGQQALREQFPEVEDLGGATLEQLAACEDKMSTESYKRCRHIISENGRVREARVAMTAGDAAAFGKLMVSSHASQRDDFECSVAETDFLADTALTLEGCYGARLTGGGFGGCTVSLVEAKNVPAFVTALQAAYRERFGIEAPCYVCEAVDGAVARHPEVVEVAL
ncbi:galactokinase [Bryocella elongata]|uniref:Galactokinase n=1 Tax=Bryocella elongata TaxID=863522 RepID=A0A1H6AYD9_9BACT|nr:galactokinase [Bryocella elongata]SEG53608.1 galactokinase [Bryocella elongata]